MCRTLRLACPLVGAVLLALWSAQASARPQAPTPSRVPLAHTQTLGEISIFFYPWYGTPAADGAYFHWGQNGAQPPATLATDYMPARGAYSSSDPGVLRSQLEEIARAGVTTLVVSWWGSGSREDAKLPSVLAAAHDRGLRVAVHVEPYEGRTPATVAHDIARLRQQGVTDFYVYDSSRYTDAAWAAVNNSLSEVRVFANTGLPGKAAAGKFTGLYTYDVFIYDGTSFSRMCASARRLRLVCVPSVGPGYEAREATGDVRLRDRGDGATYDRMWRSAIRAQPNLVSITSYNEWHEGTQIEPARASKSCRSYDGAYGLRGDAASRSYMMRTAYWAQQYLYAQAQYAVLTGP